MPQRLRQLRNKTETQNYGCLLCLNGGVIGQLALKMDYKNNTLQENRQLWLEGHQAESHARHGDMGLQGIQLSCEGFLSPVDL